MADKQTPGVTPGAMRAARLIAEKICLEQKVPLRIIHAPLAEIISRETCDRELLEALEVKTNPDDPSCHVCGSKMLPIVWKCFSCKTTTEPT